MKRRAGNYSTRLTWLKHTPVKDAQTNQVKDTYAENGFLWASVIDKGAGKLESIGSLTAQSTTEIKITNYPLVGTKDQLLEKGTETYYVIDGILRGDEGLILNCTRKQVR
jgi:hypothetical protein